MSARVVSMSISGRQPVTACSLVMSARTSGTSTGRRRAGSTSQVTGVSVRASRRRSNYSMATARPLPTLYVSPARPYRASRR